jgi:hypothetical protein
MNSLILLSCFIYLVISSVLSAYTTHKWTITGNTMWALATYSMNFVPLWIIVAKYSNNVIRDSLVYDLILTIVFTSALIYFQSKLVSFTALQIIGICLAVLGIILFKLDI